MSIGYKSEVHSEEGRLDSIKYVKQFQQDQMDTIMERVKNGEPFAICNGDEAEEIFHAFDFPVIALQYWSSVVSSKRISARCFDYMASQGYDMDHYYSLGLACTMSQDPDAPYGGMPRPSVVVGCGATEAQQSIKELWAKLLGAPYFPMNSIEPSLQTPKTPEWWDKIFDHWDEMIDPEVLDLRVADMRRLIDFMEVRTGKSFDEDKLIEIMDRVNEHTAYMAKIRDIIATARPCPVSVRDQMAMYPITWWRGTQPALDMAKRYYDAVVERMENGTCVCKDERIRLFWTSQGLWQNTKFYHAFEKSHGAVFVGTMYQSIISDSYGRNHKGDPLRALAGRQHLFGVADPYWMLKEMKAHGCHAAIGQQPNGDVFEAAGIPYLCIGGSNVDARGWDEEAVEARVRQFLDERVVPNLDK